MKTGISHHRSSITSLAATSAVKTVKTCDQHCEGYESDSGAAANVASGHDDKGLHSTPEWKKNGRQEYRRMHGRHMEDCHTIHQT